MERLLRWLRDLSIDPMDPPAWDQIRRLASTRIDELSFLAFASWTDLASTHPVFLLRMFEAACAADAGYERFDRFPRAVRRFAENASELGEFRILGITHCLVELCDQHLRRGIEEKNDDLIDRVFRGMVGFFLDEFVEPGAAVDFHPVHFRIHLARLSFLPGFHFGLQTELLTCWLGAMNLLEHWDGLRAVVQAFLQFHATEVYEFVFSPFDHRRGLNVSEAERLRAIQCLAFWLRGAGEASPPSSPAQVIRASTLVLDSLEEVRARWAPSQLAEFDEKDAWGYFTWVIGALANCVAPGIHRAQAVSILASFLELFSGRMALNALSRPPSGPSVEDAAPPDGEIRGNGYSPLGIRRFPVRREDPTPGILPAGTRWKSPRRGTDLTSGIDAWKSLFFEELPWAAGPESAQMVSRPGGTVQRHSIPPVLYERLGRSFPLASWGQLLPPATVFLGGYELPHSHRPIIVVASRCGDQIVSDVVVGKRVASSRRFRKIDSQQYRVSPSYDRAERYQENCGKAWATHPSKETLAQSLCSDLIRFHEQGVNRDYGPLVDEALERIEWKLQQVGGMSLADADLVYCPRGPLAAACAPLVGWQRRLGTSFRSITVSPSLGFFSHLLERAAQFHLARRPRLNVLTWFPEQINPGRRLIERATRELADATDLWLAADTPMATVARAGQMSSEGDWNLIFAHGQTAPTSVQLADGLFPIDLTSCEGDATEMGASVMLLLSCLAGRLTQTIPYVDSFGPITDELLLSFCLTDRLKRKPSLVGSFSQVVEGHGAVDLGIELVQRRLVRRGESPSWAQFARALQELVTSKLLQSPYGILLRDPRPTSEELTELPTHARHEPMQFLQLFSWLHFRLIGCEPFLPQ
jgi:hypothetical protein